jgi:hypothetical protein
MWICGKSDIERQQNLRYIELVLGDLLMCSLNILSVDEVLMLEGFIH